LSKLIIIGPAFPLRGGLATFNERLAKQFMDEGHEVIIYTFSLQYPNFLFPGKTQYSESSAPKNLDIRVCINSINPFNWFKVGRKLKKENADIIIIRYWIPFMGPCLGSILRLMGKQIKTKLIGLIDNALPHEKRPGDRIFTKYFVGILDGFITMSSYVKEDLLTFTSKPIQLVQHPLYDNFGAKKPKSDARQALGIDTDKFVFLFFGFIRNYKGLDLLIDALDNIKTDVQYSILIAGEFYAGEGEILQKIENSTNKDKIISRTHFIKDEDVGLYFSASDCVVQPYRNATQSGVTPLAYHFEVPMIVTNVGALPDLVPNELGIVCEPNASSIASAMESMFTFDVNTFDKSIKIEKQKLSWSKLTENLFSIFEEIK
jgi:glycosyltransferase involved in cell wall biosynthesis